MAGVGIPDPGVQLSLLCEGLWGGGSHSGHGKATMGTAEL